MKSYLPQELMIGVKGRKNIPNILPTAQAKSVAEKKVNGSSNKQVDNNKVYYVLWVISLKYDTYTLT